MKNFESDSSFTKDMKNIYNKYSPEVTKEMLEPYKIELNEYKDLVNTLSQIKGVDLEGLSPKPSLAFLVEQTKVENPVKWQKRLQDVRQSIISVNQTEGLVGVTWLVAENIGNTYIAFLKKRAAQVEDEELRNKVQIIKQMAEKNFALKRQLHERGQPCPFGGVSLDYVPRWYKLASLAKAI